MSRKLKTYLRTYRLKSGLTQKDIAFLLSMESSSSISRIEKRHKIPRASILLGYCVIFEVRPDDLAPRLLLDIENAVLNRAQVLGQQLKKQKETPLVLQRIKFLKGISSGKRYVRAKRNEKCQQGGVAQIGISH